MQETFLRAWGRWDRMTSDHGRVRAQAARALNLPVGTIESRVFHGIRMLRSIIV